MVEIESNATIFAISDVHCRHDRLVALFAKHHLIDAIPSAPGAVRWSGGDAVLVVTGNMIDKGAQSLEVLDALMALEQSAADQGGRIVVTVGNHEAEFFVDPTNSKASAFDDELVTDHVMPMAVAEGSDSRGKWLRERPFAVRGGGGQTPLSKARNAQCSQPQFHSRIAFDEYLDLVAHPGKPSLDVELARWDQAVEGEGDLLLSAKLLVRLAQGQREREAEAFLCPPQLRSRKAIRRGDVAVPGGGKGEKSLPPLGAVLGQYGEGVGQVHAQV